MSLWRVITFLPGIADVRVGRIKLPIGSRLDVDHANLRLIGSDSRGSVLRCSVDATITRSPGVNFAMGISRAYP